MVARVAASLFLTGLILGAGPCALSCGPLLLSYILGQARDARAGLTLYAIVMVVRVFIYALIGWGIGLWGEAAVTHRLGGVVPAVFLIFLGALCVFWGVRGLTRAKEDSACSCSMSSPSRWDVKAAVVFGAIVTLTPCAPLIGMLTYVAVVSNAWWKGIIYMAAFGLGTVLSPLILLCAGAGVVSTWARRHSGWRRALRVFGYILLVVMGLGTLWKGAEVLL
jgi:sulfite exporter TauE/SafE